MIILQYLAIGLTYIGLGLGYLPLLRMNRATIALVGAAALMALGVLDLKAAWAAIDYQTLIFLFGMMVISANLAASGFFQLALDYLTRFVRSPLGLVIVITFASGILSALFLNDTIALILTPLVLTLTQSLQLNPVPYLLALAGATNLGSVATISGNPQNILIGSFSGIGYLEFAASLTPIALVSLLVQVVVLWVLYPEVRSFKASLPVPSNRYRLFKPLLTKSLLITALLLVAFLAGFPPAQATLIAAALLFITRRVKPERFLQKVDWDLLVMFSGLFILTEGVQKLGMLNWFSQYVHTPLSILGVTTVLSNLVSIVLTGKVRLLDEADNLIVTLNGGESFGEGSLFPEEKFTNYTARASTNVQLCCIAHDTLLLLEKYPSIYARLHARALRWDLLLLCRHYQPDNTCSAGMFQALSLFERHDLEVGLISKKLFKDTKLWVLQRGELVDSAGRKLAPFNICDVPQDTWQAIQPTIVYSLSNSNWLRAIAHWSGLAALTQEYQTSDNQQLSYGNQAPKRHEKVVPFPLLTSPKPQQKPRQPYFPTPKLRVGHYVGRLIKRYPFFAQQSASDCGAACLVMIGRYWDKKLTVNLLRDLANTSRSGASLKSLATAAETVGFATRPVKASLDQFAQQPLPAIAHWEGKHYIVVYEITKKRVIVGDPGRGQQQLTISQFNAGWTGYALLLQPTTVLKEAKGANQSFWKFFELIAPHKRVLLEVLITSVLIQVFGLVTPLFTQLLLDRVIVQGSTLTLNAIGIGLVVFSLFRSAMNGLRQYLLDHTANRISVALLVGFIKHTLRLPLAFFESRYVGDIMSRVQENQKIQRFSSDEALSIILDLLTVFIYLGLMFWYSWRLALLVLLIVPPFFILALVATPLLRRISREIFNATAEENSYLIQILTGIRSIRSMAVEQVVRWRWEELLNQAVKKGFAGQVIANRLSIFSSTIESLLSTALLWLGASLVIQNQLTIGQLVAFNMLLGNVILPFQRLSVLWNQLQEVMISVERINDVLEAEPEENLQYQIRQSLHYLNGHIRFENVTFRYHSESDANVLENISFEALPEETVAIVGRSGSGKTTLGKLILGLYPVTEGKLLIDGQDIANISLKSLREQIGVVDQDTFLFGGTIRENLSLAYPEAALEEIIEAARLAGADEFIRQLPMGYETQIGEGGGMLSGGQRQRLAIARALLGNPRLLIFDEATSHLDTESERIIQNNLKTILKGRTTLIIAHRLSTIRNADLILVLDRGVLVESGTHDELIKRKGHYYYLNQQQLAQTG